MTIRLISLLLCLSGASCAPEAVLPQSELAGYAMGTTFNITVVAPPPVIRPADLKAQILGRLEEIEDLASTYRDSSEISKFNASRSTDWIAVSDEFCAMTAAALQLGRDTGGAFDITVGPLVELWGFGRSPASDTPPSNAVIDAVLASVGFERVEADCRRHVLRKPTGEMQIDLSAWAKGYAVDQLAKLLDDAGLQNYLVEIGGEVRSKGQNRNRRAFVIAIEDPDSTHRENLPLIRASDIAVATSGNYRNFFIHAGQRYGHTLDPRSGWPTAHNLSAVTVVHESAAYADGMATALLVLGADDGLLLADKLGIAAYFAVATAQGLRYRASAAFQAGHFLQTKSVSAN